MIRLLLAGTVLVALPLVVRAGDSVVRLNLRPMPTPKPALKYQLLPEVRELNPGNPVQDYLKCFAEQRLFFFSKEAVAERTRYLSIPLAELAAANVGGYGGNALRQADWAARLEVPDWTILQRVQTDGLDLLLPELDKLRILATALQARLRIEVAGRRFDDAVRTAKTMFALARHLGEHPSEPAGRLGLSVAERALKTLEEMVQQPGCPNLYWALTELPCPLVDLRKGVQGDCALVMADLRPIRDDALMTEEQIENLVSRLSGVMGFAREQAGLTPRNLRAALAARIKDSERIKAGRRHLIEVASADNQVEGFPTVQAVLGRGLTGGLLRFDMVQKFSPVQVILLEEKRAYEQQRDERLKLLALAPWQIDSLTKAGDVPQAADGLFADFLPQIVKLRRAQGRLEQRMALLRHVEALRLYAAAHDGRLPEKLADVSVPLPDDPFTGKPFEYRIEAAMAQLRGRPPRVAEHDAEYNVCYEVTIQPMLIETSKQSR